MSTLSIVIPCYNEEPGLHQLFSQINILIKKLCNKYKIDFVFVDDGSTDNTFQHLKNFKKKFLNQKKISVTIIRHKMNKNLGAALKSAFIKVKGDLIVTVDADCTYSLLEVPKLLSLLDYKTDIVVASPYHPKGTSDIRPRYRLFLSKLTSKAYSIILNANIHTYTSIFRVYRRTVIDNIKIKSDNFIAVTELLVHAIKRGYYVKEIPANLTVRKYGQSKMRVLSTIKSHFLCMLKLALDIENVKI